MTLPYWADTPDESDAYAAALLDHQDQQADRADHECADIDPDVPNQWRDALATAYRNVGALRRTA